VLNFVNKSLTLSVRKTYAMKFDLYFTNQQITPWGGMVFLKQMMDKMGFRTYLESCEDLLTQKSNRGYKISTILESFITSV